MVGERQHFLYSQQLQSLCLREDSMSPLGVLVNQDSPILCVGLNSEDSSFSYNGIHQVVLSCGLKGKVLYFLQAVLCIRNRAFFLSHWRLSLRLLSSWGCLPPPYFSHKSSLFLVCNFAESVLHSFSLGTHATHDCKSTCL